MKVLYIGCYRDGTGWAHAAQGYILSLDAAGIDVVPRFIKLNNQNVEIPKRIEELENKSDKNCDIVIQHVLPHLLDYNGNFDKNISLYVTETDSCENTSWPERINLMDEAWVPNSFMIDAAKNNHMQTPHKIVPHAADINKFQKKYEPIQIEHLNGKFVFYFIGEMNRRKNIWSLLKAFHLEFGPEEDVGLLIKAHVPGSSPQQTEAMLRDMSSKVKEGLKLYTTDAHYHREVFVCDYLSEEQIMQIHATGDCFASATYGEAWGIPVFDAMAMGKTPICTDTGGPRDFIKDGGYLVNSRPEPCFGMVDTFSELYVGNECWDSICIKEMRKSMRSVFENKEERERKSRNGINQSYDYSYELVGAQMKNNLEQSIEGCLK